MWVGINLDQLQCTDALIEPPAFNLRFALKVLSPLDENKLFPKSLPFLDVDVAHQSTSFLIWLKLRSLIIGGINASFGETFYGRWRDPVQWVSAPFHFGILFVAQSATLTLWLNLEKHIFTDSPNFAEFSSKMHCISAFQPLIRAFLTVSGSLSSQRSSLSWPAVLISF